MKTALVHDWLIAMAGAEKVLEALYEIYPSKVFTLLADRKKLQGSLLQAAEIQTSFLQKFPRALHWYRNYLPLFPLAIEQLDVRDADVVISSSHAVAKGVLTHSQQLHICYCHTPIRYGWDLYHEYQQSLRGPKKILSRMILHKLRNWDVSSSTRVDHFIANSHYIAQRIEKIYGKKAHVIYPPVATDTFQIDERKDSYYITVSRLVPYKKIDMMVEAFRHMPDKKLIVIGEGPEYKKILSKAPPNVALLGFQSDEVIRRYIAKAKAFLFAAEEDFGITPVEAQASGVPVIAFGRGGVLETVIPDKTGLFFFQQNLYCLVKAIHQFEKKQDRFDPKEIKAHAESFNRQRFMNECKQFTEQKYKEFYEGRHPSRR